jgi:SAM-dependent methyltransferase
VADPDDDGAPAVDVWGALARTYRLQEPLERRSALALLRVLAPQPHELVVDVGSGVGKIPRSLAVTRSATEPGPDDAPARVVALEPSPRMLAAGRYAGAQVLRADAARLPLADASVDVVTAAWVLHVLTEAHRDRAVAEIARVLRPGGRLGLAVPAVPATLGQQVLRSTAHAAAAAVGLQAFVVPTDLPGLLTDHGLQVRHHTRTRGGYLADVVVCTRSGAPR